MMESLEEGRFIQNGELNLQMRSRPNKEENVETRWWGEIETLNPSLPCIMKTPITSASISIKSLKEVLRQVILPNRRPYSLPIMYFNQLLHQSNKLPESPPKIKFLSTIHSQILINIFLHCFSITFSKLRSKDHKFLLNAKKFITLLTFSSWKRWPLSMV